MSGPAKSRTLGPTLPAHRSATADVLRGVGVLAMFAMSAVAYGLPHAAFFNLQSPETNSAADWFVAIVGELLFDQKAVALIAMLFGASVISFTDRARAIAGRSRWFLLRRTVVLFGIGVGVGFHGLVWEGTPLWFLAFASPVLFLIRNRSPRFLVGFGSFWILFSALMALEFHPETEEEAAGLGQYWFTGAKDSNDNVGGFMSLGTTSLLIGAMVIGLAIGRTKLFEADPSSVAVRRMVRWGLGAGLPLIVASMAWRAIGEYEPSVAIIAEAPHTVAVVPLTLAYAGLIMRWVSGGSAVRLVARLRAVGQMALTHCALQTVFGILVLRDYGFGRGHFSRSGLWLVVILVWLVQLAVSAPWLARFNHGPLEWILRVATYRRILPFVRADHTSRVGVHT